MYGGLLNLWDDAFCCLTHSREGSVVQSVTIPRETVSTYFYDDVNQSKAVPVVRVCSVPGLIQETAIE